MIFMKIKQPATPEQRFDLRFPEEKKFDLVGLGQNAVDEVILVPGFPIPDTKSEILKRERMAGGQVATALVFASRLGLESKYIG